MAKIEKLEEHPNIERELTDEEIDMVAGGSGIIGTGNGWERILRGFQDLFTGQASQGWGLIRLGWNEILGRAM